MAFTRFHDDPCRIEKQLQEWTDFDLNNELLIEQQLFLLVHHQLQLRHIQFA